MINLNKYAAEVPDSPDIRAMNYWKWKKEEKLFIYLEGWCDECYSGTGFSKYDYQSKINYAQDLTPTILKMKALERNLILLEGDFIIMDDKNFIYGVTVGIYRKIKGK